MEHCISGVFESSNLKILMNLKDAPPPPPPPPAEIPSTEKDRVLDNIIIMKETSQSASSPMKEKWQS